MREERDCFNCEYYVFSSKSRLSKCKLDKKIKEWDGDYDFDNQEEDDNFGAYPVNEVGEKIECLDFVKKEDRIRGELWRSFIND